jgi:transposase
MKKPAQARIQIERAALTRVLEHARPALSEEEYAQLAAALDTLVYLTQMLENKNTTIGRLRKMLFGASSEKSARILKAMTAAAGASIENAPAHAEVAAPADAAVVVATEEPAPQDIPPPAKADTPGHGRHGADDYPGARTIRIEHAQLVSGQVCPECRRGKVYETSTPGVLVRVLGQAPLTATVYELAKLRCNLCLEVFTADPPPGVGSHKYDAGAASMIALLKYGSGVLFYRLRGLQASLGIPLPASTQWEIVEQTAQRVRPALEALIRAAAQGEVLHNDDTPMVILASPQPSGRDRAESGIDPERCGTFTSGIVATGQGHKIALFFTGQRHAGENLASVLAHRLADLGPPVQMCDALSRNLPKPLETIVAHCIAHARRKYVEVTPNFPEECRFVIETLAEVYHHDATCKQTGQTGEERLRYHQTHSAAPMKRLEDWLAEQFTQRRVEPNSGLGAAITYMRRHWPELTLFLRRAGAPLDNNVCEMSLKRAILHRKNALFYRTQHGAEVGDTFMSLIHTCSLVGANPFTYLTTLQECATAVAQAPQDWLPWNYQDALARVRGP